MTKLRVAVVSGYPPDPHGEAHYSGEVYTRLADMHTGEVEICVLAHFRVGESAAHAPRENLTVARVTGASMPGGPAQAVAALRDMLTTGMFDIVHFQGPHTAHYGGRMGEPALGLLASLKKAGIPTVVTMHSTWLKPDLDDLWSRKKLPSLLRPWASRYAVRVVRQFPLRASLCRVLVSGDGSPTLDEWTTLHRLKPGSVVAEPHPCHPDPVEEHAQTESKLKLGVPGVLVIAALGFIRPDKGLHHLVEAAPRLLARPGRVMVLGGNPSGPDGLTYASSLREQVERLGLGEKVKLEFRYMPDEEMEDWFRAADLIALPYERAVGASGPIHHALSKGKPVLATRVGQNRGLEGVVKLFDLGDTRSLIDAAEDVLGSPSRLQEVRKRALAYARSHTWEAMAEAYLRDYRQLVQRTLVDSNGTGQVGSRFA